MTLLAIHWSVVGVKVGQLILALSILVILHEFGHYITARWFKCRVEKFYLFFDPWFSLVKKKVGDTEYGIGWLPLGGYVKISGMIDESMDTEAMKLPPKPYEFRSKPAWQRLIIMLGGVIMNVLLAFFIYAMILWVWGDKKIPNDSLKYGIGIVNKQFKDAGFLSGDKIEAIDGKPIINFDDITEKILIGTEDRVVDVERDGKKIQIPIKKDFLNKIIENRKAVRGFISPRVPSQVGKLIVDNDTLRSYNYGMREGDIIIAADDKPIAFFDEIAPAIEDKKDKNVVFKVVRGKDTVLINEILDCNGKAEISMLEPDQYTKMHIYKIDTTKYTFFEAFPAGVNKAVKSLTSYVDQFKMIFKPETGAYKGLGGFKGMTNGLADKWDWEQFWMFTAFLSMALAFMNLLPIPALDGGHVVFTLYEMITGRKPNEKFLEYAQIVGIVLLLGLMLYANGNDWFGYGKSVSTDCK
ncbi:MAG: RIP metalloprotease RseP [Bacteroidetes bacterium]|nr:RIP metalloprotease RseP [Bacteroidota bacterium]